MPDLEWYYVSHVIPDDIPNQTMPFEVQVLGKHGEAEAVGYIDVTYDSLAINGKSIPSAVIEAVKRYPLGFGDYVDSAGKRLDLGAIRYRDNRKRIAKRSPVYSSRQRFG